MMPFEMLPRLMTFGPYRDLWAKNSFSDFGLGHSVLQTHLVLSFLSSELNHLKFCLGKFHENVGKTIHVTTSISFIMSCGLCFLTGDFPEKGNIVKLN